MNPQTSSSSRSTESLQNDYNTKNQMTELHTPSVSFACNRMEDLEYLLADISFEELANIQLPCNENPNNQTQTNPIYEDISDDSSPSLETPQKNYPQNELNQTQEILLDGIVMNEINFDENEMAKTQIVTDQTSSNQQILNHAASVEEGLMNSFQNDQMLFDQFIEFDECIESQNEEIQMAESQMAINNFMEEQQITNDQVPIDELIVVSPGDFAKETRGKPKRVRTVFTKKVLIELERAFQVDKYLSKHKCMELCNILKLNESQVKVWFQNRRMKYKKMESEVHKFGGKDKQHLTSTRHCTAKITPTTSMKVLQQPAQLPIQKQQEQLQQKPQQSANLMKSMEVLQAGHTWETRHFMQPCQTMKSEQQWPTVQVQPSNKTLILKQLLQHGKLQQQEQFPKTEQPKQAEQQLKSPPLQNNCKVVKLVKLPKVQQHPGQIVQSVQIQSKMQPGCSLQEQTQQQRPVQFPQPQQLQVTEPLQNRIQLPEQQQLQQQPGQYFQQKNPQSLPACASSTNHQNSLWTDILSAPVFNMPPDNIIDHPSLHNINAINSSDPEAEKREFANLFPPWQITQEILRNCGSSARINPTSNTTFPISHINNL